MHDGPILFPLLIAGLFGALIGSFLNVCIYRLPRLESIAWPGSHCPRCTHPIAWYDNIPIISYLVLAGQCRHCGVRIPFRYPMVEILNALGYVGLFWFFGPSWATAAYGVLFREPLNPAMPAEPHEMTAPV